MAQYLGKVSYPLYLTHGVMLPLVVSIPADVGLKQQLVTYALFLFWAFASTSLLHNYVELPFRNRFNRWAQAMPGAAIPTAQGVAGVRLHEHQHSVIGNQNKQA